MVLISVMGIRSNFPNPVIVVSILYISQLGVSIWFTVYWEISGPTLRGLATLHARITQEPLLIMK